MTSSITPAPPRALNFNAGPAALPLPVLQRVQAELLNYANTGMSVMEMSHRSAEFEGIVKHLTHSVKSLMGLDDDWHILLMQGGGSGQFAAVPMNLLWQCSAAAYIVTGSWSAAAAEEAKKFVPRVAVVASTAPAYTTLPSMAAVKAAVAPARDYAYVHYCHNETVHGVEFDAVPDLGPDAPPLIADLSSCFLSRPIAGIERLSAFYAGAQKNVGPAGLTIVGLKGSLLCREQSTTPNVLSYTVLAKAQSLFNTPPAFAIYVTDLVLDWIAEQGLTNIARVNEQKAALLYQTIEESGGMFACPVEPSARSRMNVVFRLPSPALESAFLSAAKERDIIGIAGHRSVGGCRVSLYNAVSLEQCQQLVHCMHEFRQRHQP